MKSGWTTIKNWIGNIPVLSQGIKLLKSGWTTVKSWIGNIPVISQGISLIKSGWTSIKNWIGSHVVSVGISLFKSGWSSLSSWIGDKVSVGVSLFKSGWSSLKKFFGLSDGGYNSGHGWKFFERGGFIDNGQAQFWKNIPMYANGTTNAGLHGSMFVAGENGAEMVGHINGQTEVLNRSQIAMAMKNAVVSGMSQFTGYWRSMYSQMTVCSNAIIRSILVSSDMMNASLATAGAGYDPTNTLASSVYEDSQRGICACFPAGRDASCNYAIGTNGKIALCVEEKNRSWCSSNEANDQRAVTIECASDKTAPYAMNNKVYQSLINLCVDICKRNGKTKLIWFGDKSKTLNYSPKSNEMVLTVHRWFANKSCPGDWLYSRLGDLATQVTKKLGGSSSTSSGGSTTSGTLYRVQTGAFSKKANADALVKKLETAGYDTYVVQVDGLYKVQTGAYSKKANADAQVKKLKADGFDAFVTTKTGTGVSSSSGTKKKSNAEIAKEIYNGTCSDSRWSTWGNGQDRVNRLTAAGYDYDAVQAEVNKLF